MAKRQHKPLTRDVDQLHTLVYELSDQVEHLQEMLALALRRQFGSSKETLDPDIQPSLFPQEEVERVEVEIEPAEEDPSDKKPKAGKRQIMRVLSRLPVDVRVIDLDEHQKDCDCCGCRMKDIGEDISRQIIYIPAQLRIQETHRKKYACKECEQGIQRAPLPFQVLQKSMASPSLLAYLICSKFVDHLPYYRLEKRLTRLGLALSRESMSDWLMTCAEALENPYLALKAQALERNHLFTDDTILPMQNTDPERRSVHKARIWVYATNDQRGPPVCVYDFSKGRQKSAPLRFMQNFQGYLQADGYAGYQHLYDEHPITEVACMAHARRKFVEAAEVSKTPGRAHEAVLWIRELYKIEKRIRQASIEERLEWRQEKSLPILERFRAWLDANVSSVLPKSALGKAFYYILARWDSFTSYCQAGELEIDNNLAERLIKPIALGRKNFLFVGNERAGHAAAKLYSLVETCALNQINPLTYLSDALQQRRPVSPLVWVPSDRMVAL